MGLKARSPDSPNQCDFSFNIFPSWPIWKWDLPIDTAVLFSPPSWSCPISFEPVLLSRILTTGAPELTQGPRVLRSWILRTTQNSCLILRFNGRQKPQESYRGQRLLGKRWRRQGWVLTVERWLGPLPTLAWEALQSKGLTEVSEDLSEQLVHSGVVSVCLAEQWDCLRGGGRGLLNSSPLHLP